MIAWVRIILPISGNIVHSDHMSAFHLGVHSKTHNFSFTIIVCNYDLTGLCGMQTKELWLKVDGSYKMSMHGLAASDR
jgi:hypothetical protein